MKLDVKGQTMISLPQPRNCGRGWDIQLLIYLGPQVLIQQQFQLLVLRTELGLRGFNVSTPNVKQPKSWGIDHRQMRVKIYRVLDRLAPFLQNRVVFDHECFCVPQTGQLHHRQGCGG